MYQIIALLQLLVFIFIMRKFVKEKGLVILVDQVKIMFILWMGALILYDFTLSSFYKPTLQINLITIFIWVSFLIMAKFISLEEEDVHILFDEFHDKDYYKLYALASNTIFIIAALTFAVNVNKYGLMILEENKINKQMMDHYAGYIVYMLVLCGEVKYILFRNHKKWIDLLVFIGSVGILVLTINRGPIAFLFITIGIYEVFSFINIKETLSKKQKFTIYGIFIALILAFIWFFGYIGSMRMEFVLTEVYKRSLWEHYGVPTWMPEGFLWIYIYLTSTLENAAYALAHQVTLGFTFMGNLFYPFVKLVANVLGQGDIFKDWLMSQGGYVPHLQSKVGLNAMTFIPEAFHDLGIAGFIIYVLLYVLLAYLSIRLIKSRIGFSSIGKILIYTNITSILLWSIFVNSFKIPILILNIFGVLFIEGIIYLGKRNQRLQ